MNAQVHSLSTVEESFTGKSIIIGVLVALAVTAILNILGLATGLIALGYAADGKTLGISGFLWLAVTSALGTFIGAWVSAYLSPTSIDTKTASFIHGISIWAATTLITIALAITTVGGVLSGTGNVIKNIFSSGGQSPINITAQVDAQTFGQIKNAISDKLGNVQIKPEKINQVTSDIKNFLTASNEEQKQAIRSKLADTIAQNSNLSSEEANQLINDWQNTYNDLYQATKDKVQQAAKTTSKTAGGSLFGLFLINALTLIAAYLGALVAIKRKYAV